ncbi:MAG: hypothetical protein ACLSHC_10255 [Bilophila wadsworthia]
MRQGQLVCHGRFGLGQDSLLQACVPVCGGPVAFARRYITRPLSAMANAISPFRTVRGYGGVGEFMMDWRSHGLRYGIGKGVETLAHGAWCLRTARGVSPALRRFPDLVPVFGSGRFRTSGASAGAGPGAGRGY